MISPRIYSEKQVTEEMMDFWGRGFSTEYYLDVQRRYNKFMEYEPEKIKKDRHENYKMLCHYERRQLELLQNKYTMPMDLKFVNEAISKLAEDLNIKAIQKKIDENNTDHYIIRLTKKYIEDARMTPKDWSY